MNLLQPSTQTNASDLHINLMFSMRIEIDDIKQWLIAKKMTLDARQTKYIIIASKNKLRYSANAGLTSPVELLVAEASQHLGAHRNS